MSFQLHPLSMTLFGFFFDAVSSFALFALLVVGIEISIIAAIVISMTGKPPNEY